MMTMAIALNFPDIVENLSRQGLFQYVLTSLLVFLVVYAILIKTKIVGNAVLSALIAGVIALFVVLFAAGIKELSAFFSTFLARVGIILVVVLMILMIYKFVQQSA